MSDLSFTTSTQTQEAFSRVPQIILLLPWFFVIAPTLCTLQIVYVEVLRSFRARKTSAQHEQRPKETTVATPITQVSSLRIVKYESGRMGGTAVFRQVEQEYSMNYLTEHWRIMREKRQKGAMTRRTPRLHNEREIAIQ